MSRTRAGLDWLGLLGNWPGTRHPCLVSLVATLRDGEWLKVGMREGVQEGVRLPASEAQGDLNEPGGPGHPGKAVATGAPSGGTQEFPSRGSLPLCPDSPLQPRTWKQLV